MDDTTSTLSSTVRFGRRALLAAGSVGLAAIWLPRVAAANARARDRVLWKRELPFTTTPTVGGNRVAVRSYHQTLALEAATGEVAWSDPARADWLTADSRYLLAAYRLRGTYPHGPPPRVRNSFRIWDAEGRVISAHTISHSYRHDVGYAAIVGEHVVVREGDFTRVLRIADGVQSWHADDEPVPLIGDATAPKGVLLGSGSETVLRSCTADENLWTLPGHRGYGYWDLGEDIVLHSGVQNPDHGGVTDHLTRVNAGTGHIRWETPLGGEVRTPATRAGKGRPDSLRRSGITGTVAVIATGNAATAIDIATGQQRWRSRYEVSPVGLATTSDHAHVLTSSGLLTLKAGTGEQAAPLLAVSGEGLLSDDTTLVVVGRDTLTAVRPN